MKKKILIICFSYLHKDPRVLRQVQWLRDKYEVSTVGFSPTGLENGTFFQINPEDTDILLPPAMLEKREILFHRGLPTPLRKLISIFILLLQKIRQFFNLKTEFEILQEARYFYTYWTERRSKILQLFSDQQYKVVIANDINTLPIAIKYREKYKAKILLDSHEYHPLEFDESHKDWVEIYKPLTNFLCHFYIPKINAMTTVCQGIADEFEKNFKVKPSIITNATQFYDLKPQDVCENKIRLIHHGICSPMRHIDLMIKAMSFLDDRFYLDFILIANDADAKKYLETLKQMAQGNIKITFLAPISTNEIANYINQYDMGIYLLLPTNFNNLLALPNKFFEFIQARLGIAIATSPEMARIVNEYDLGIVSDDFTPQSLAKKLNELTTEKVMYYKNQSHKYAYELSAEKNKEICLEIIDNLLK